MSDNVEQKVPENDAAAQETVEPELEKEPDAEAAEQEERSWEAERAELEANLKAAREEQERLTAMYMRLRADFDNLRRRSADELEKLKATAASDFIIELLPVIDNLERAVAAASESEGPLAEGVRLVLRQVHQAFEKAGVEPIPGVGEPFDPEVHEAIGQVPCEDGVEPGTVVDEVLKGYRMGERVLRPSMVRVAG